MNKNTEKNTSSKNVSIEINFFVRGIKAVKIHRKYFFHAGLHRTLTLNNLEYDLEMNMTF